MYLAVLCQKTFLWAPTSVTVFNSRLQASQLASTPDAAAPGARRCQGGVAGRAGGWEFFALISGHGVHAADCCRVVEAQLPRVLFHGSADVHRARFGSFGQAFGGVSRLVFNLGARS